MKKTAEAFQHLIAWTKQANSLRACFKRHVFGGFALKYDSNKGAERWQGGTSEAVPPIKTGLIHPTRDHFILLKQALKPVCFLF
jgi:hypothetical protein